MNPKDWRFAQWNTTATWTPSLFQRDANITAFFFLFCFCFEKERE